MTDLGRLDGWVDAKTFREIATKYNVDPKIIDQHVKALEDACADDEREAAHAKASSVLSVTDTVDHACAFVELLVCNPTRTRASVIALTRDPLFKKLQDRLHPLLYKTAFNGKFIHGEELRELLTKFIANCKKDDEKRAAPDANIRFMRPRKWPYNTPAGVLPELEC